MISYPNSLRSPEFRNLQEVQTDARTADAISVTMGFNKDITKRKDAISTLLGKASDADAPIRDPRALPEGAPAGFHPGGSPQDH